MNKPYYATYDALHPANRDSNGIASNPPPPPAFRVHLVTSAYNPLKDNFTPESPPVPLLYSGASAARDVVLRGFLSPHNKASFGLRSADYGLKSTPYIFRNKYVIISCGRFAPRKEKRAKSND
ncbi:MAG: hypothetical protein LBK73_01120 [Treponema sp.]|jgi:hypothetical protein|nr:hypothetical protein [Treponema sp.]